MAIGLVNYPNRDTTDPTNYPDGRIKDDPAGLVGTPIKESTIGDYVQFFDYLLRSNGITPNNTPDNVTNTYQYIQGLLATVLNNYVVTTGNTWASLPVVLDFTKNRIMEFNAGNPNLGNAFTLPTTGISGTKIKVIGLNTGATGNYNTYTTVAGQKLFVKPGVSTGAVPINTGYLIEFECIANNIYSVTYNY